MNAFVVDLENKPGALAAMTEAIADKGIDITGLTAATCGDSGSVTLIMNDDTGTRRALVTGRWNYRPIELLTVSLQNTPGAFSKVARKLGDGGVNIESVIQTSMSGGNVSLALATDNPTRAKEILAEHMLVGATRS